MTVKLLGVGDIFTAPDGWEYWPLRDCGKYPARALYCAPCKHSAPNRHAMAEHVKAEGEHEIVSHCPTHGYEALPPKSTQEAA